MTSYSFLLIGCGRIGKRHAEEIIRVGKLAAVCDVVPEKAIRLGREYEALSFSSLEDVFSSNTLIDFAVICTPNGLHAMQTIQCLRKGLHVICEKPMAIKLSDCHAMIDEGERAQRKLFVVKQNRFNPPVMAAKKKIDEGAFGRIFNMQLNCFWNREAAYYHDSWRGTKDLDGGTLFTQFSHFIDLVYWLLGDVEAVQAFRGNYKHQQEIQFEDTGVVILKFKSGAIGTINYTVNAAHKNMEGSLTLFGEKATVKIGGQYLNTIEYAEGIEMDVSPSSNPANDYGGYTGSMSNHGLVYDHILDVMNNDVKSVLDVHDAMMTVQIIERIYES